MRKKLLVVLSTLILLACSLPTYAEAGVRAAFPMKLHTDIVLIRPHLKIGANPK